MLGDCFHKDVHGHFFCFAVFNSNVFVYDALSNKVISYVDVFCACVIVIFGGQVYGCLVVAE